MPFVTLLIAMGGLLGWAWRQERHRAASPTLAEQPGGWSLFPFRDAGLFGIGIAALAYTHGWTAALGISGLMIAPLCGWGLFSERLRDVAHRGGSHSIPELFHDRFQCDWTGKRATTLCVLFLSILLAAVFKAGKEVLRAVLQEFWLFRIVANLLTDLLQSAPTLRSADVAMTVRPSGEDLLSLTLFLALCLVCARLACRLTLRMAPLAGWLSLAAVMILLVLVIPTAGGLPAATEELAAMTPPRLLTLRCELPEPTASPYRIPAGTWFAIPAEGSDLPRLIRTSRAAAIYTGKTVAERIPAVEITTPAEIDRQLQRMAQPWEEWNGPLGITATRAQDYLYGAGETGVYVQPPGPHLPGRLIPERIRPTSRGFLPPGLAMAWFVLWGLWWLFEPMNLGGLDRAHERRNQPDNIISLAVGLTLITLPVVALACCARVLLPGLEDEADRILPETTLLVTAAFGQRWLTGILLAPLFATLVALSVAILHVNGEMLERSGRWGLKDPPPVDESKRPTTMPLSTWQLLLTIFGAAAPSQYLVQIVVYAIGGLAGCLLAPLLFTLYWRRCNRWGALYGMGGGFLAHFLLHAAFLAPTRVGGPILAGGVGPLIWSVAISALAVVVFSLQTDPPPPELVARYFDDTPTTPATQPSA